MDFSKIDISAVKGFLTAGIKCGLKKNKLDLGCIYSKTKCKTAVLFTKNHFKAAPVLISQKKLKKTKYNSQLIIVNSGVANACTGKLGIENTNKICKQASIDFNLPEKYILNASTGKIGNQLPLTKILPNLKKLSKKLSDKSSSDFEQSILTTDTIEKKAGLQFNLNNKKTNIAGVCKGSGMIEPNMATMLSFICTDINIKTELLQKALDFAVKQSFNKITVDGDMSTNDSVYLFANGMAENKEIISEKSKEYKLFKQNLTEICISLAKQIVLDGEGANKLITINVKNASNNEEAEKIAKKIANSNLVKTAFFGCDFNWGRIISSVGSVSFKIKPEKVEMFLEDNLIFKNSEPVKYNQKQIKKIMKKKYIELTINMNAGKQNITVWTCDLSYDYVKINAEYST